MNVTVLRNQLAGELNINELFTHENVFVEDFIVIFIDCVEYNVQSVNNSSKIIKINDV